mgnify:FL=1
MDARIKNYLGVAGVVLMAALALSALQYVKSYSKVSEPSSFRSFSASGDGKAVAIPDVAQFTFSVLTQGGKDLGALQKENTTKINRAIGVVKAAGVEDKDIKTEQYSVEPRYQYFNCFDRGYLESGKLCPPPEIVGYTVQQTVSVKVRDFEKVGQLLGEVVQSGANSVSQLSFTLDDPTSAQNEARAEAIAKAKAKAKSIAKAGGFRLGRLLSIEEGGYSGPIYKYSLGVESFGGAPSAAPAPAIEAGSQEVNVTITLRYEID